MHERPPDLQHAFTNSIPVVPGVEVVTKAGPFDCPCYNDWYPDLQNASEGDCDVSAAWREVTLGDPEERKLRMKDPAKRKACIDEWDSGKTGKRLGLSLDRIIYRTAHKPEMKNYEDRTNGDIAKERGQHIAESFLDISMEDDLQGVWETAPKPTNMEALKMVANRQYVVPGVSDGGVHTKFITALGEEIEGASKEIFSTEEQMQEALDTRHEESADFKKAQKDDSDAVALLAQAVDSLTAFYNNNKIPLALVAGRATAHGPEDVAPEANFGGPAKSESQGIIAILKMLKEDLSNEMPESKKAETQAAADFARTRSAALASLNAQKKKRTDLETQQADLSETINGHEKDISAKEANHVSKEEELKALAPNCEWLKGAFDKRREARKQEIDGLIQGKATLSGAGDVS